MPTMWWSLPPKSKNPKPQHDKWTCFRSANKHVDATLQQKNCHDFFLLTWIGLFLIRIDLLLIHKLGRKISARFQGFFLLLDNSFCLFYNYRKLDICPPNGLATQGSIVSLLPPFIFGSWLDLCFCVQLFQNFIKQNMS